MRVNKTADRSRLIAAAMGKIPCDLTVGNIRLLNVFTGEIYPAEVDILDGMVVRVRTEGEDALLSSGEYYDGEGRYLIPGFIDTHMHVESTMMIRLFLKAIQKLLSWIKVIQFWIPINFLSAEIPFHW